MKIMIGGIYRHRINPDVGYAKVIEIIPPKKGINKTARQIVKVQWCMDDRFIFGLVKYFNKSDLVKG